MGKESRRRQIIVNPELQRQIIFATAWVPCVAFALTSALLGFFCVRVHDEAVQADAELPSLIPLFAVTLLFTFVAGTYTVWSSRKLSNRIAGPMHNLVGTLRRFRDGDRSARLQLREGDFLRDIEGEVNEFLAWCPGSEQDARAAGDPATGDHESTDPRRLEAATTE